MGQENAIGEEVFCECGDPLIVLETAVSSYSFRVREDVDGQPYTEFGKCRSVSPVGDNTFECGNPDCHNVYSQEEVYKMVKEQ